MKLEVVHLHAIVEIQFDALLSQGQERVLLPGLAFLEHLGDLLSFLAGSSAFAGGQVVVELIEPELEARLAQLGLDQLNDDLPARERTAARKEAEKITKVLKECQAWEQDSLLPLAQQRIELDLDDGVKVNYLKLQEVLAPIPGLAAKED